MKTIRFFYLLVFAAALGWGQAVSSLSGVVTDSSGAVVPGATVKIENVAQGLSREAKTDQAGRYALTQVPPGTYKLSEGRAGIRGHHRERGDSAVNLPTTLPLTLEVGKVSESVAVSAEAMQVNTTDASIGNAISTSTILELPLNGAQHRGAAGAAAGRGLHAGGRHERPQRRGERRQERPGERDARRRGRERPDGPQRLHQRAAHDAGFGAGVSRHHAERQRRQRAHVRGAGGAGHQGRHQRSSRVAVRIPPQHHHLPPTASSTTWRTWSGRS